MLDFNTTELSVRKAAATDALSSADLLTSLSHDPDCEVRRAVAGNPNTPTEILAELGKEFPEKVTANPIFKIWILEDPYSLSIWMILTREQMQRPDASDAEVLYEIAQNSTTPSSILENLVLHPPQDDGDALDYEQLWRWVAKNPNTSASTLGKLGNSAAHHSMSLQIVIAENPKTPQQILEQYAVWRNSDMHQALMRNPNLPASALEILAGIQWPNINIRTHLNVSETAIHIADFIAGKSDPPQYILEKLACDHRSEVRILVAEYPNTLPAVLEKLSRDQDKSVRKIVANHPHLSSSALEEITRDLVEDYLAELKYRSSDLSGWESTLLKIMRHPNFTSNIIEIFIPLLKLKDYNHKDCQRAIIDAILKHEKLSEQIITKLIQDPECFSAMNYFTTLFHNPNLTTETLEIYIEILLNPSQFNVIDLMLDYFNCSSIDAQQLESFMQQFESQVNGTLAKYVAHPNILPERLEQLSTHPFELVRRGVAKNPNTPISALQMLATHSTLGDPYAVAQNPNVPANLLLMLAVDREESVRGEVAKNTKTPLVILETLADDESPYVRSILSKSPSVSHAILSRLAADPVQKVRQGVVYNPNTPAQTLNLFIDDPNYQIQVELVQHSNTSVQTLLKLAEKSESHIRQSVGSRGDNLSPEVLEKLMDSTLTYILAKSDRECDRDQEDITMERVAKHPNTSVHILEQFATNQPVELYERFGELWFKLLRRSVANNASTPTYILEKLVNDPQFGMGGAKEAAQQNLRNRYTESC